MDDDSWSFVASRRTNPSPPVHFVVVVATKALRFEEVVPDEETPVVFERKIPETRVRQSPPWAQLLARAVVGGCMAETWELQ